MCIRDSCCTLLVIFTAAVVALVAHALGLAWGTAWIIGAAVAPTDATVLTSMAGRLSRGQQTTCLLYTSRCV